MKENTKAKAKKKETPKQIISKDTLVSDIMETYPEVAEFLMDEYGLHCIGCFMAEFDTLEEGAEIHGIIGADFQEMLNSVNQIINKSPQKEKN